MLKVTFAVAALYRIARALIGAFAVAVAGAVAIHKVLQRHIHTNALGMEFVKFRPASFNGVVAGWRETGLQ